MRSQPKLMEVSKSGRRQHKVGKGSIKGEIKVMEIYKSLGRSVKGGKSW